MPKRAALGVSSLVVLALPAGCSLMNLDELGARSCQSDRDCAEAQRRARLDPELCGHCVEGACDFQRRSEICNGQDDDCDGAIDEDVSVASLTIDEGRPLAPPVAVATAWGGDGMTYVAIGGAARRGFVIAEDGRVRGPDDLGYRSALGTAERPCPAMNDLGKVGTFGCSLTDLALAIDGEQIVYATINTAGCGAGQVRVGLADREAAPFTVWLGKRAATEAMRPENVDLGVDVDDRGCSGASLEATGDVPPGARSPAAAGLDARQGAPGGLVSWLAASAASEPTCSSMPPVPVLALGVYVPEGKAGWLAGTNRGVPVVVGSTTSLAPPAVAALNWPEGSANYVVAFASEEEGERGVRLVEVRARGDALEHQSLAFIADPSADRVVLTTGALEAEGRELGVAWTSACETVPSLRFTTVSALRPAQPSPALTLKAGEEPRLPQLLHRQEGFSTSGARGGYFLLWSEQASASPAVVKLARLATNVREPLNVVTLAAGVIGYPLLLPNGASSANFAHLAADDHGRERVESFGNWCSVTD